jgi:hypothetical protein
MGMSVAYVGDGEAPVEAAAEFLSDRCRSLGRKNTYLGTFGTIEYIEWKLFAIGWDLY